MTVSLQETLAATLGTPDTLAAAFSRAGVDTLRDLFCHLPIRYENRSRLQPIAAWQNGQMAQTIAEVLHADLKQRKMRILTVTIRDDAGTLGQLVFFNAYPKQQSQFIRGRRGLFFGKIQLNGYGYWQMAHPDVTWLADGKTPRLPRHLSGVYGSGRGLTQNHWRTTIEKAFALLPAAEKADPLSAWTGLPTFTAALKMLHFPSVAMAHPETLLSPTHPARQRLIIEELLVNQIALASARAELRQDPAPSLPTESPLINDFRAALPFSLTDAQQRAYDEICADLRQTVPMLRLVQGDVGSGKTIIALLACLHAVAAGKQAVFLTPTELLAEQHFHNICRLLAGFPVKVVLLVSKMRAAEKRATLEAIAGGSAGIIVGTHAVFQEKVQYADLALIAIDEQHRFGVHQRLQLQHKSAAGRSVHQLVLTATPIPRTLAMSQFGELDTSIIDSLPAGRQPIHTSVIHHERRGEIIERVRAVCAEGRQVYWVCPLIEESEKLECENAETIAEQLTTALPELNIALLHGRIPREERGQIMADFAAGTTQLLVATTVIEVGVDVPNASIMIVENAERFGMVQLHQLRGRIGRGREKSYCLLLYQPPLSAISKRRLNILASTTNGFQIAEEDLAIRGAGELLGTKQTGEAPFLVAELPRDEALLLAAERQYERLKVQAPEFCKMLFTRWKGAASHYLQV